MVQPWARDRAQRDDTNLGVRRRALARSGIRSQRIPQLAISRVSDARRGQAGLSPAAVPGPEHAGHSPRGEVVEHAAGVLGDRVAGAVSPGVDRVLHELDAGSAGAHGLAGDVEPVMLSYISTLWLIRSRHCWRVSIWASTRAWCWRSSSSIWSAVPSP